MLANLLLQIQTAGAEVATQAAETTAKLNIFSLAVKGGWIMIVLALVSIVAVYIFVERFLALKKALKEDVNFMDNVKDCIHKGDLQGAKRLAQNNDSPIGRMIGKGLARLGRPLNDINQAIENVGKLEVARLESGVSMVGTIAALGPSLGFLGTVIGMVMAFDQIQQAGDISPTIVASGMKVALITTIFGIIVALILQVFYNYILSKIEHIISQMEESSITLMDIIAKYKHENQAS